MSISTITNTVAFQGAVPPVAPAIPPVAIGAGKAPLKPAVQFDIRTGAKDDDGNASNPETEQREARIRIDQDTRTIVYQEVDPASGDVVIQLPDPVVLKARAYADRAAHQAAATQASSASPALDRTA